MIGRFACLTAMVVAAMAPAPAGAQSYDPQMPPPYSVTGGYQYSPGGPGDGAHTYGRTRYTQLPDDKGFSYGDTNLERFLKETFRHSYFRLEYLNWSYSDPGDNTLGAPILRPVPQVLDPDNYNNTALFETGVPFEINNDVLFVGGLDVDGIPNSSDLGPLNGYGLSPSLEGVKNIHNNGIRGTWGFNFEPFTLESSIFALQASRATVVPRSVPVITANGQVSPGESALVNAIPQLTLLDGAEPYINGTFIVQGLLDNGALSNQAFLIYDRSYQASVRSSFWGADSKIVMEGVNNGGLFSVRPLYGVKFVNFNERVNQQGTASARLAAFNEFGVDNQTEDADPVVRQINAATQNYLYGPQLGARFELGNRFFTVGFEPKMMFGVNSYRSTLDYSLPAVTGADIAQFDENGDPILDENGDQIVVTEYTTYENVRRERIAKTTFGPVADVEVYARGRVSDHFNLFVA